MTSNIEPVLRAFVERIERQEEEKAEIAEGIKQVYAEAKASGFDAKAMRRLIALRKMDPTKRRELSSLVALYGAALGMDEGDLA